jgi:hypothetical protein
MIDGPGDGRSDLWGPLRERYARPGPRRLLALDGGGIRGVMTLEILAEIERQLRELRGAGPEFRLCHFFDYVGGTSTGAIIAAGLARGMSVAELLDFYAAVGPQMFDRAAIWNRWKHLYDADPLQRQLQQVFGADADLFPASLRCLLLVVTRNSTTDSPWPISSNPLARYNDPARPDCNLRIPLWRLVRASTAAPVYFPPEVIEWDPKDPAKAFVFVDGGITPYNNPALLLYRMATLPEYRLGWPSGEDRLMLVSVGTGSAPLLGTTAADPETHLLATGKGVLGALMNGAEVEQDLNCRVFGRCVYGHVIDRELGDLVPRAADGEPIPLARDLGRAFLYARYQPELTAAGLAALDLVGIDPAKVQALDAVDRIDDLRRIGRVAGARHVRMTDFGALASA